MRKATVTTATATAIATAAAITSSALKSTQLYLEVLASVRRWLNEAQPLSDVHQCLNKGQLLLEVPGVGERNVLRGRVFEMATGRGGGGLERG